MGVYSTVAGFVTIHDLGDALEPLPGPEDPSDPAPLAESSPFWDYATVVLLIAFVVFAMLLLLGILGLIIWAKHRKTASDESVVVAGRWEKEPEWAYQRIREISSDEDEALAEDGDGDELEVRSDSGEKSEVAGDQDPEGYTGD